VKESVSKFNLDPGMSLNPFLDCINCDRVLGKSCHEMIRKILSEVILVTSSTVFFRMIPIPPNPETKRFFLNTNVKRNQGSGATKG